MLRLHSILKFSLVFLLSFHVQQTSKHRTTELPNCLGAGRSQTSDTFHSFGHVVPEGVTEPMLRCCDDLGTTWEHGASPGSGQGDYEQMVASQKPEAKLSRSTWNSIQADRRSKSSSLGLLRAGCVIFIAGKPGNVSVNICILMYI